MIVQSLFFCIVVSTWLIDNQDNNNKILRSTFNIQLVAIEALFIPHLNILVVNTLNIEIIINYIFLEPYSNGNFIFNSA